RAARPSRRSLPRAARKSTSKHAGAGGMDEDEVGLEGRVIAAITRFEEGMDGESAAWLGGPRGFAYLVAAVVSAAAVTVVTFVIAFLIPLRLVQGILGLAWMTTLTAVVAFGRRQRLAAHFEAA